MAELSLRTVYEDAAADNASGTVYSIRKDLVGTMGLFQVHVSNGDNSTFTLEGRATPTADWVIVLALSEADVDANDCAASRVVMFPEMRINLDWTDGTADAWLSM